MTKKITSSTYFNPDGGSPLDDKIWNQSNEKQPTGFIDFNRPKYKWSKSLYDTSMNRFWTPQQINMSDEKKNFNLLSEDEKELYKKVFAQLSFDDSIQSFYLADLSTKTNNTIVRSLMIKQAEVEILHSNSYAFLLDVVGNSDEVFDMFRTDPVIANKNARISSLFARHINGNSMEDFLLSSMASVVLEGIFFLTGFSYIFVMSDKIQGSSDMLQEIAIDEVSIHLPMFANVCNTVVRENNVQLSIKDKMISMLNEAVDIELEYAKHISKYNILGINYNSIKETVENFANDRAKILNLPQLFPTKGNTYLQNLIINRVQNRNAIKTAFFEGNVKNYSKGSIDMDF